MKSDMNLFIIEEFCLFLRNLSMYNSRVPKQCDKGQTAITHPDTLNLKALTKPYFLRGN